MKDECVYVCMCVGGGRNWYKWNRGRQRYKSQFYKEIIRKDYHPCAPETSRSAPTSYFVSSSASSNWWHLLFVDHPLGALHELFFIFFFGHPTLFHPQLLHSWKQPRFTVGSEVLCSLVALMMSPQSVASLSIMIAEPANWCGLSFPLCKAWYKNKRQPKDLYHLQRFEPLMP